MKQLYEQHIKLFSKHYNDKIRDQGTRVRDQGTRDWRCIKSKKKIIRLDCVSKQ